MTAPTDLFFLDALRELHLLLPRLPFVPVAAPFRPLQHLAIRPVHCSCAPPPSSVPRAPGSTDHVPQPRRTPNCP